MKKAFVVFFLIMSVTTIAFANGNAEKQTTIEGTVLLKADTKGNVALSIEQDNGEKISVSVTAEELAQLQLKNEQKIKVKGVFIGSTAEQKNQERIIARTLIIDSVKNVLKDPVQLTEQDRIQIKAYETEKENLYAKKSGTISGAASGTANGNASGTVEGTVSGIASEIISGISSGSASGTVSGSIPGVVSGSASGSVSGSASGSSSGSHSGSSSGNTSGSTSGWRR